MPLSPLSLFLCLCLPFLSLALALALARARSLSLFWEHHASRYGESVYIYDVCVYLMYV
jgi:hypothetical protein